MYTNGVRLMLRLIHSVAAGAVVLFLVTPPRRCEDRASFKANTLEMECAGYQVMSIVCIQFVRVNYTGDDQKLGEQCHAKAYELIWPLMVGAFISFANLVDLWRGTRLATAKGWDERTLHRNYLAFNIVGLLMWTVVVIAFVYTLHIRWPEAVKVSANTQPPSPPITWHASMGFGVMAMSMHMVEIVIMHTFPETYY